MSRPASFKGTCRCGAPVAAGALVTFDRGKIAACHACDPNGHPEVEAVAPMELRVKVQRVRSSKPDGSWTVAEVMLAGPLPPTAVNSPLEDGQSFVAVGPLGPNIQVGDLLDVFGAYQHDPRWGWQFRATRGCPVVAGTDQALRAFLARFPQVGPRRAEQIMQKLGGREAVLEALEHDPVKLTVVDGITEARALDIAKAYVESSNLRDSAMFLAGLEMGEALTAQILDEYGADAKQVLLEDPYQLMGLDGIGFKRADDIAMKLKVHKDDPRRLAAATLYILEDIQGDGHTFSTENDVINS